MQNRKSNECIRRLAIAEVADSSGRFFAQPTDLRITSEPVLIRRVADSSPLEIHNMNLQVVLEGLHDSGIHTRISSVWALGWDVELGGVREPQMPSLSSAAQWLHENALLRYAHSQYAINAVATPQLKAFRDLDFVEVLQRLYDSEIDVSVRTAERGWAVELMSVVVVLRTQVRSLQEVARWLHEQVLRSDPGSGYAARNAGLEWSAAWAADQRAKSTAYRALIALRAQ
jgi:hypothetical protein